jgi:hypothetical protein
VEDLAANALQVIIDEAPDHTALPDSVLERVANRHPGKKAWQLAGTGWKTALKDNLKEVLSKTTGTLNTPRTQQVDDLFEKVLGISKLSSKWRWSGRTPSGSARDLDALVTLRGSIAHRVEATRTVRKKHVQDARHLIWRLAIKSHNAVNAYVASRVGPRPWQEYMYEPI